MARLPRYVFPSFGFWHVTARGVDGTAIVRDRDDALVFLRLLAAVVRRHALDMHAMCLMTNHYHLVLQAARDALSAAMHRLNGIHAAAFNRRHRRRGHLFGDRFWTETIESEEHLRSTCRYVILNPVRAGLCSRPSGWAWLGSRYGLEVE